MNNIKPFCAFHIIFLSIFVLLMIIEMIIINKKKSKKLNDYIITINSILLVLFVLLNRILKAFNFENFLYILPTSFCSYCAYVFGISSLFRWKKSLYFSLFLGITGAFTSTIYPDYLNEISLINITSLIYHALMFNLGVISFKTGQIDYNIKNTLYYILGFFIMLLFGFFQIFVLKFDDSMNIYSPIIKDLKFLTSHYLLFILSSLIVFGINALKTKKISKIE